MEWNITKWHTRFIISNPIVRRLRCIRFAATWLTGAFERIIQWNCDFLHDGVCVCVRVCARRVHKGATKGWGRARGRMVKKTAISQAKSSITSEHTRNTWWTTSFCRTSLEIEREREGGGREGRWIYARSGNTKVQSSFRLTAYLIKTTLSPCTPLRFETSPSTSVRGDETSERKRKICTLLNLDCK